MGYSVAGFVVDLDELRAAIGSRNEALLTDPEADQDEPEVDDGEELSAARACRQLVMGEPLRADAGYAYGYALAQLCRILGQPVSEGDVWEGADWRVLQATGMAELLEASGAPITLPKIDDFPGIGHLTADQVREWANRARREPLANLSPSGRLSRRGFRSWLVGWLLNRLVHKRPPNREETREYIDEFTAWILEAESAGKGLVFFYS